MARFTKELRQEIIREFCLRRNAAFDAALFAREVIETGPEHKAWEWFTTDKDKAAWAHWTEEARGFAQGLKVSFTVEEIGRSGSIRLREVTAPLLVSPIADRRSGGGYFITDPANPDHMGELCYQAAADLRSWLRRYDGALAHAGGSVAQIEKQLALLDAASPQDEAEEAA